MRFRKLPSDVWSPGGRTVTSPVVPPRGRSRSAKRDQPSARAETVRRYLEAFFAGDDDTARALVTADLVCRVTDDRGRPVTLIGFDAARTFANERWGADTPGSRYRLFDFLAADDQVCVVFEEEPPLRTEIPARQLSLWGFRGDRIASLDVYGPAWISREGGDGMTVKPEPTVVLTFAEAWMAEDMARMESLCHADVTCRWIGFAEGPPEATGLEAIDRIGRGLERARRGPVTKVHVVDHMHGRDHVALLLEATSSDPSRRSTASLGVYRVVDGRIASITIYADRRT